MPGPRRSRRQSQSPALEPSSEVDDQVIDVDAADADAGSDAESRFPETQFQPVDNSQDDDELYAVKSVLGEDTKARLYLLEWEGLDPDTGYDYRPTWEPKEGCTDDLIKDWKKQVAAEPGKRDKKYANKQLKAWDEKYRLWVRSQKRKLSIKKSPLKQGRGSDAGAKRKRNEEEEGASRKKTRTKTPSVRHASVTSSTAGPSAAVIDSPALRRTRQSLGAASPLAKSGEKRTSPRSNTTATPLNSTPNKKSALQQASPAPRATRGSSGLKASASPRQTRKGKQVVGFAVEDDDAYAPGPDGTADDDLDILDEEEDAEPVRKSPRSSRVKVDSAGAKAVAKSGTNGTEARPEEQVDSQDTIDEETFPDPRNAEDETYRPPTRASRATPSKSAGDKKATSKTGSKSKALGPVPQPPLAAFKQPERPATPTQATVSTQDDIQAFSSPIPAKKKDKGRKDSTQSSKDAESMEETETGLIRKKVDGEWVLVPAAPSQSQEGNAGEAEEVEGARQVVAVEERDEPPPETQAQTQMQGMKKKVRGGEVMYVREDETDSSDDGEQGDAEGATVDDTATPADGADGERDVDGQDQSEQREAPAEVLVEETLVTTVEPVEDGLPAVVVSSQVDKVVTQNDSTDAAAQTVSQAGEETATEDQSVQVEVALLQSEGAADNSESSKVIHVASPSATEGGEDLSSLVGELRAQIRDLQSRNATLIEEGSFLRDQYSSASTIAATQAQEASRLQAEVDRKTKQLRTAVKQRDVHWKAILDARESEEARLKGTVKILTDQSRLTGDHVRMKAASYDRMQDKNLQLMSDNEDLHTRLGEMKRGNDWLETQVQYLKMQLRDAGRGERGEEEEDGLMELDMDDGTDESDAESTGDEGDAKQRMRKKGYAVRHATSSLVSVAGVGAGEGMSHVAKGGKGEAELGQTEEDGSGVICEYNVDGGACGLIAESREALEVHLREHTVGIKPLP